MRILAIGSVLVLGFFAAACSDEERPNDIPRTVPPVLDGAASAPVVKGIGPTIEVINALSATANA